MSELRELYQEIIIDHGRRPRNFGAMPEATHQHEGFNPLCGDKIIVYANVKDAVLNQLRFDGCGCAISMASASLLTETLQGQTLVNVEKITELFHELVTSGNIPSDDLITLGKLAVLKGVCEFPARVKCATLAWHTLKAALSHATDIVSTEVGDE